MIIFSENSKIPDKYADFLKKIATFYGEEENFKDIVNDTMEILRLSFKDDISDAELLKRASLNGIINDLDVFKEMVSDNPDKTKIKTVYMEELNALYYTINDIFRTL